MSRSLRADASREPPAARSMGAFHRMTRRRCSKSATDGDRHREESGWTWCRSRRLRRKRGTVSEDRDAVATIFECRSSTHYVE